MTVEDKIQAINGHITRIQMHQRALGLSDAQFCQRYSRYLGSPRTWRHRLCERQFGEVNLEATEIKLHNMVAELDGRSQIDHFVSQLPFAQRMTTMFNQLQEQKTDRRCGVCLGITGVGKSAWARHIVNQNPREAVYVRCNEAWRDSRTQISRGLAEALGCAPVDFGGAAVCMNRIIARLRNDPVTILLDESHEGGTVLLKLVKTLIDESLAKFILLAYPTTWNKMLAASDDSRSEAQQLFGRTLKPVFSEYSQGVKRADVTAFLAAATELGAEADLVAGQIISMVRANGNLRLVADAVENAQLQVTTENTQLTASLLVDHVKALCPTGKGGDR